MNLTPTTTKYLILDSVRRIMSIRTISEILAEEIRAGTVPPTTSSENLTGNLRSHLFTVMRGENLCLTMLARELVSLRMKCMDIMGLDSSDASQFGSRNQEILILKYCRDIASTTRPTTFYSQISETVAMASAIVANTKKTAMNWANLSFKERMQLHATTGLEIHRDIHDPNFATHTTDEDFLISYEMGIDHFANVLKRLQELAIQEHRYSLSATTGEEDSMDLNYSILTENLFSYVFPPFTSMNSAEFAEQLTLNAV